MSHVSLADEYARQLAWRDWATALSAVPLARGQRVLDLGCGTGDVAALLVARGARVPEGAEFRCHDLRALPELGGQFDGLWCSFGAAYFPDLAPVLAAWLRHVRPGGWVALTEVDAMFGHEPLGARSRALLDRYAAEALATGRYDFTMGRKLASALGRCGARVDRSLALADRELAFQGPARADVLEAWRARLARLRTLQSVCGDEFAALRDELLACMAREDHRSTARVVLCTGTAGTG